MSKARTCHYQPFAVKVSLLSPRFSASTQSLPWEPVLRSGWIYRPFVDIPFDPDYGLWVEQFGASLAIVFVALKGPVWMTGHLPMRLLQSDR